MYKKFFQAANVKKGNLNKPIIMGFLKLGADPHQAAVPTDPGCTAA